MQRQRAANTVVQEGGEETFRGLIDDRLRNESSSDTNVEGDNNNNNNP